LDIKDEAGILLRPEVDWDLCEACDPCEARLVCKTRAIVVIDPGDPVFIQLERCNGCGECVLACPFDAIQMKNSS
jgi:MinD superfamily P-loop ATPase